MSPTPDKCPDCGEPLEYRSLGSDGTLVVAGTAQIHTERYCLSVQLAAQDVTIKRLRASRDEYEAAMVKARRETSEVEDRRDELLHQRHDRREQLAKSLGIHTGRTSWWDADDKDDQVDARISLIRNKIEAAQHPEKDNG